MQSYYNYYAFGMEMPNRNYARPEAGEYRYGFNGKEKENELNEQNYDFGARIYDSRIGKWLSIDPLQAKYPAWSPYHGMANSPIIIKDEDGRDWVITVTKDKAGNTTVHLKLTGAIINSSGRNVDVDGLKERINEHMQNSYSRGEVSARDANGKSTSWNVKVTIDLRIIKDTKELRDNDHLIQIVTADEMKVRTGGRPAIGAATLGGKNVYFDARYVNKMVRGDYGKNGSSYDQNTIPHEFGHSLGLEHPNQENGQSMSDPEMSKDRYNAMYSNTSGDGGPMLDDEKSTNIDKKQIDIILKKYDKGELNKPVRIPKQTQRPRYFGTGVKR